MSKDSDKTESSLPKLRTFAADLERERGGSSTPMKEPEPTPEEEVVAEEPVETPKPKKMEPLIVADDSKDTKEKHQASNPPFHTIAKHAKKEEKGPIKIDTSDFEEKHTEKAPSVLESVQDKNKVIIDEEDDSTGTIVSDVKRKRFRFFPSLFESIRQSLIEFGELFTSSNKRKYSVPESSHRKGVIQTATSNTGRAATGDHDQVISRIKQKRKSEADEEAEEKKKKEAEKAEAKEEAEESDAPITDPAHLLEDPEADAETPKELATTDKDKERNITKVAAEPRRSVTTQKAVVPNITPVVPQTPVPSEPPAPIAQPAPVQQQQAPASDSFVKQPVVGTGALNNQVAINEERADATGEQPDEPLTADTDSSEEDKTFSETNILAIGTVVSILLIFTAFLVIRAVLMEIDFRSAPIERYEPHVFLEGTMVQTLTLPQVSRPALINAIVPLGSMDTTNTTQINPVVLNDSVRVDIPADELLSLLYTNADGAFSGAVEHIAFGVRSSDLPFIMMDIGDTESARGGFLQWEQTMHTDLAPLLGINGTSSEPTSTLTPFTDDTINGIDVRVNRNPAGNLYYGFVTADTILIATTETDFATVADMLQE